MPTYAVRTDTILAVTTFADPATGATKGLVIAKRCGTSVFFSRINRRVGGVVGTAIIGDSTTVTVVGCAPPDTNGARAFNDLVPNPTTFSASSPTPAGMDTAFAAVATTLHGDTAVIVRADTVRLASDTSAAHARYPTSALMIEVRVNHLRPRRFVDWLTPEGQAIIQAASMRTDAGGAEQLRLGQVLRISQAQTGQLLKHRALE